MSGDLPLMGYFEPESDRRITGRIDARIGAGVTVKLVGRTSDKRMESEVVDYSSLGLGIEIKSPVADHTTFHIDEPIELSFTVRGSADEALQFPCKVSAVSRTSQGHVRLGLQFLSGIAPDHASSTLAMPEGTALYGLMEHPFLYDQTSLIQIKNVSRNLFVAVSHDRSFAVFPTMGVVFSMNLFGAQDPVHGRVVGIRPLEDGVEFVITIERMSEETEDDLVRFVLTLVDLEPFQLRKVGFRTDKIKDIINFRFVRTQQEYYQTLQLRHITYAAVKKLSKSADLRNSSFDYDRHSRILGAWHHDRLVGSAAIYFADGVEKRFVVQNHLSMEDFAKLPDPATMIEVVGLCLHHNYRKSDILVGIFQRLFKTMIETSKTYIVACCDSYLWKIYESIGFKKTGLQYTITKNNRLLTLDVILVHRHVGTYGWSLDPMRWDEIYAGVADYLDKQGILPKSPRHLVISPIYKAYIRSMHLLNPEARNRPQNELIRDLAQNDVLRGILETLGLKSRELLKE